MGYLAKNDELFFTKLSEFDEKRDIDTWRKLKVAIRAFHEKPRIIVRKKIQAFSVSTDFAKLTSDAFNVTIESAAFDLGYEKAFRTVPLGDSQDTWDIYDVTDGLTFNLVKEGGHVKIDGLKGEVQTCHVDYYGGAIGWTDKMIRFRKVAAMVDMALIFRNRFWQNKADNHYLLLAAAAVGNVTAYQGVVADGQLRRDIATLNRAAFDLANRCKDKGYGDTASVQLVIYANPLDKSRILAALASVTANLAPALSRGEQVQWNITPVFTFNSNIVSGAPVLVLPGNKMQMAEAMSPTTFVAPKDPLTLNEVQSVWSIYGAAIGDSDQVQTVTLG